MNLQPIVVIPSFWTKTESGRGRSAANDPNAVYAHPTPLDAEEPSLIACLDSLGKVRGLGRIVIVVRTTDSAIDVRADERVREIVSKFPALDIFVMGSAEIGSLFRRLEQLELASMIPALEIDGYGAARNLGLIAAAVHGAEATVFLDDHEVIDDEDFLETALFGVGHPIATGGHLYAKSGFYVDEEGRWTHSNPVSWTDLVWRQDDAFNRALGETMKPPRLQRAKMAFGGCMIIHRDMYTKIAFDPWITRGEDTDYVINARMHGADIYMDDTWKVRKNIASRVNPALKFRHDVYRFVYEHRKLEFAKSQVDLRQITPKSLMPFPGMFIDSTIAVRAFVTGILRAIVGPNRGIYFSTGLHAVREASDYARANCANYFTFQRAWAYTMERLWKDVALESLYLGERSVDRTSLTGQFKAITGSFSTI